MNLAWLKRWEVMLGLVLVLEFVLFTSVSPYFLDVHTLSDASFNFTERVLVALPLALLIIAGEIDISVAAIIALASVAMGLAAEQGVGTPGLVAVGLGTGLAAGEWQSFDPSAVSTRSLLAFAYLVVFGSIIAFTAYSYLLRNARPTVVSTYAFVNPIVAVLLGWLVAGEALTSRVALAGLFILGALWAILRDESEVEQAIVDPDPTTGEAARSCAG